MKRSLIIGNYGAGNLGDELILQFMQKELKGRELVVLTKNKEITNKFHNIRSITRPRNRWEMIKFCFKLLKFDEIVLGGGSLLFDEKKDNPKNVFSYLIYPILAKKLGKMIKIYKIGVGPIYSEYSKKIIRKVFNKADSISVRDPESKKLLKSFGVIKKISLAKDPVEYIKITDKRGKYTIFFIRPPPFFIEDKKDFNKRLKELIYKLRTQHMMFCTMENPKDKDYAKELGIRKIYCPENFDELIKTFGNAHKIISMRLHPLIIGHAAGKKLVGIDVDPKIRSYIKKCGGKLIRISDY